MVCLTDIGKMVNSRFCRQWQIGFWGADPIGGAGPSRASNTLDWFLQRDRRQECAITLTRLP